MGPFESSGFLPIAPLKKPSILEGIHYFRRGSLPYLVPLLGFSTGKAYKDVQGLFKAVLEATFRKSLSSYLHLRREV